MRFRITLIEILRFLCAEQDTGVDTRIVEVDFLDDFVINDKVMEVIRTIDIGILSNDTIVQSNLRLCDKFYIVFCFHFAVNTFQVMMPNPAPFVKVPLDEINVILNSNIKSLTMITYVVMTGMLQRNRGLILNLSAFSGLYPVPFISVYSASKVSILQS